MANEMLTQSPSNNRRRTLNLTIATEQLENLHQLVIRAIYSVCTIMRVFIAHH